MAKTIRQLIKESKSIIDLEGRLKELGNKFPTKSNYINFLEEEWSRICYKKVNGTLKKCPVKENIPTITVISEGVEYKLHGIVHGGGMLQLGWGPRRKFKDYISETMKTFHNPNRGEDYLYEENMNTLFDLIESAVKFLLIVRDAMPGVYLV